MSLSKHELDIIKQVAKTYNFNRIYMVNETGLMLVLFNVDDIISCDTCRKALSHLNTSIPRLKFSGITQKAYSASNPSMYTKVFSRR